jgi:hypothetical protein
VIIRSLAKRAYTVISNVPLNDDSLSWEARGLLAWLLSKPDSWKIIVVAIKNRGPAGRDKIERMLSELEKNGYLFRKQRHGKDGRFTYDAIIYEEPLRRDTKVDGAKNCSAGGVSPADEPPLAVQPQAEKPGLDNRHLINTERSNPKILTTEKEITDHKADGSLSSLKKSENQENSERKFRSASQTSDTQSNYSPRRPRGGLTDRERRFYEREERRVEDLVVAPARIRDIISDLNRRWPAGK